MNLPDILHAHLDDESIAARVALGGEDELFVTSTRTLVYRAEGLLSDESVESYSHDAERILVSEGRRKTTVTLDYGLDGEESFSVPTKRIQDALHPVLAGVLNAAGITDSGETVKQTYRFSELTLVITSSRVVKHIGSAVWDDDYEEYHYDDVTDLTFEEGSVATSVVITIGGRQERFKAPNEEVRAVREGLTSALLDYYGVESLAEFRTVTAPRDAEGETDTTRDPVDFGDGPTPLSANPSELSETPANATRTEDAPRTESEGTAESTESPGSDRSPEAAAEVLSRSLERPPETDHSAEDDVFEGSGFESTVEDDRVTAELAALREAVERQNEELRKQRETVALLVEELRQGR